MLLLGILKDGFVMEFVFVCFFVIFGKLKNVMFVFVEFMLFVKNVW